MPASQSSKHNFNSQAHRKSERSTVLSRMPKELREMKLPTGLCWIDALSALEQGGFILHSRQVARPRDWSEWEDGAAISEPIDDKSREFAILSHPAGFLVTMNSTQGGYPREPGAPHPRASWSRPSSFDAEFDPLHQELNSIVIHYQVDSGLRPHAIASAAYDAVSFTSRPRGDGCWILEGKSDVVNGGVSMEDVFLSCYRNGSPMPISQWRHSSIYLETGHYSQGPSGGSAADIEGDRIFFKTLFESGFLSLTSSLPVEIAAILKYSGPQRFNSFPEQERSADFGLNINHDWNCYIAGERRALGANQIEEELSAKLASWAVALGEACRGGAFAPEYFGESHFGSNILHAIASLAIVEKSYAGGEELRPILAWLESQSLSDVSAWARSPNASGQEPGLVALAKYIDGRGSPIVDEGAFCGLLPWLIKKRLFAHQQSGAVGSLAEKVLDIFKGIEADAGAGSYRATSACRRSLQFFAFLEEEMPSKWAAPLAIGNAVISDEFEALSVLADIFESGEPGLLTALAESKALDAAVGQGKRQASKSRM